MTYFKTIKKNKKAYLDYEVLEEYIFWIQLKWFEVKQIRLGNVDIRNAFCKFYNNELYIEELNIPLYEKTSSKMVPWYNPKRKRKLLGTKKELKKLLERTTKTWLTIIPLEIWCNHKCKRIKIKCALAKLRRKIEKKQIIKERDIKRDMDRTIKSFKY
jgi:SsrA-binding protein